MFFPVLLLAVAGLSLAQSEVLSNQQVVDRVSAQLIPKLSGGSFISFTAPPRWSTYDPPDPAVVINVNSELDVSLTVGFLTAIDIPFVAQNGGNGWATTFDLKNNGVLINLRRLNKVIVSSDKTTATIGGGASINETIAAADAAGVLVQTGNCNCVGTLGALLGGGYGNTMGLFGFAIDNVISFRVVLPGGKLVTASASSNPDLFWALKGAGPNFGIVTSAVVKAYPRAAAERTAWTGGLIFTPDKLEQVVTAIQNTNLKPEMNVFMYFISANPGVDPPVILTTPFLYKGTNSTFRAAFANLYAVGPVADTTSSLPYTSWNTGGDGFCARGPRKPSFGAGFQKLYPSTFRKVWDLYTAFQSKPGAAGSVVLLEAYSLTKARSIPASSASFPYRNVNFNAVAIPWYSDPALDGAALAFGRAARNAWRATDDLPRNSTYVNFAHGDEDDVVVYGDSLPRLQRIRQSIDPKNVFDQWFDI